MNNEPRTPPVELLAVCTEVLSEAEEALAIVGDSLVELRRQVLGGGRVSDDDLAALVSRLRAMQTHVRSRLQEFESAKGSIH